MATKLVAFMLDLNVVEAMKRILARGITGGGRGGSIGGYFVGSRSNAGGDSRQLLQSAFGYCWRLHEDAHRYGGSEPRWMFLPRHPVVCEGKLVGQVSRRDVLRAAVDYSDR